jgi:hypothetical protein
MIKLLALLVETLTLAVPLALWQTSSPSRTRRIRGWNSERPFGSFFAGVPVRKYCSVYNLQFELFHTMEAVVGSIPTRSTIDSERRRRIASLRIPGPAHNFDILGW